MQVSQDHLKEYERPRMSSKLDTELAEVVEFITAAKPSRQPNPPLPVASVPITSDAVTATVTSTSNFSTAITLPSENPTTMTEVYHKMEYFL